MGNEKIGLKDIIELAKAGLKKDDIFEILDRVDRQNESSNPETVDDESNIAPDEEHAEPETVPETEPEQSEPDYKALYMVEKAKREKLQKDNVNKDNGGNEPEKTDQDILNEIASSLM